MKSSCGAGEGRAILRGTCRYRKQKRNSYMYIHEQIKGTSIKFSCSPGYTLACIAPSFSIPPPSLALPPTSRRKNELNGTSSDTHESQAGISGHRAVALLRDRTVPSSLLLSRSFSFFLFSLVSPSLRFVPYTCWCYSRCVG